jgi:RING finger protein 170
MHEWANVFDVSDCAGVLGLFGFFDDFLILVIVFLHLAAVYRSLLLYRHGGH